MDPSTDAGDARERYVIDGLALVRTVLDWIERQPDVGGDRTVYQILAGGSFSGFPWDLPDGALPNRFTEPDKLDGVARGIDVLADALDALGDLTMSEAVHQIVRGNHTRAAAVLSALAEGTAPPVPEIADSPRTGLPVTHRVLLQVPAQPAEPVQPPPGWTAVPPTPRSAVEPSLNAWLAGLLGDPATIRVRLRPPPGAASGPAVELAPPEVSVADLGLQPLDLLAIVGPGYEGGVADLTARVLDHRRPINLEPDQPVQPGAPAQAETSARDAWVIDTDRAPAWGPAIRSVSDVAGLLEAVGDLLGRTRPAVASDYAAPETTAVAGTGIDADDLATRVDRLTGQATEAALALARLLSGDQALTDDVLTGDPRAFLSAHDDVHLRDDPLLGRVLAQPDLFWGVRETWRSAVIAAGRFGVKSAPPRRYATRDQVCRELLEAAETGYVDLTARLQKATAAMAAPTAGEVSATARVDAARALLGEAAALVPRVGLDPIQADLADAADAPKAAPDELDGWLEGAAAVRSGAAGLADVLVLAEAAGRPALRATVTQLPHIDDEPWLGGALADPSTLAGRVSRGGVRRRCPPGGRRHRLGAAGGRMDRDRAVPRGDHRARRALRPAGRHRAAVRAGRSTAGPGAGRGSSPTSPRPCTTRSRWPATGIVEPEHLGADLYGQMLPLLVGEVVPKRSAVPLLRRLARHPRLRPEQPDGG